MTEAELFAAYGVKLTQRRDHPLPVVGVVSSRISGPMGVAGQPVREEASPPSPSIPVMPAPARVR